MSPTPPMPTAPSRLDRARDLRGRAHHPWVRRIILLAMTCIVVLALSGTFGQEERVLHASGDAGTLDLRLPSALRGGLLWRARMTVRARTRIERPQLILGAGYVSGMQLNTIEPGASEEGTRGDALTLTYGTLQPGQELTVYLQLQVNPETRGRQDLTVALEGGGPHPPRPVRLPASAVVLP